MLDVATGTGAIARGLVRRYGCSVVGVDQSPQMLDGARDRIAKAGLADRIELRLGSAEEIDLEEGSFDALTTGYLLRYLDDPLATMSAAAAARSARARPFALLDFGVPPNPVARAALAALHRRRPAGARPAGVAGVVGGRPLPAAEHPAFGATTRPTGCGRC